MIYAVGPHGVWAEVSEIINFLSSGLLFAAEFHFPVVVRELELGLQALGSYPILLVVPAGFLLCAAGKELSKLDKFGPFCCWFSSWLIC